MKKLFSGEFIGNSPLLRSRFIQKPIIFLRRRHWLRRILFLFLFLGSCFFLLDLIFPFRPIIPYSQLIIAADGSALHGLLARDDKWRMKTERTDISPTMKTAFLEKEDKWFYWHFGVNPIAVARAAVNNVMAWKTTSGASTITMQVARLLEPKNRTIWNKLLEMFRAVQLEVHYSKEEILELYLNLVPYGGNIEGVKAASLLYFGTLPEKLSLAQIVALTIIPNRPTSLALGKNNEAIVIERNRWLQRFAAEGGVFPPEDIQAALAEPLDAVRRDPPKFARHLAVRLARQFPDEPIIRSTIVPVIQQKVQNLAYNYARRWALSGVFNAAVIVINNQTGDVEGYVGNPDFDDAAHQGQVDGVKAVRSPGSTLKPLVYGMAFDAGIITPKTVITDVPVNFDGFAPENFNRKYNAAVPVEKALAFSLNVPAVKLMSALRPATVTDKLIQAGFRQIAADKKQLGLSTILGGCGVRLEELAALYTSFARKGRYHPLRFIRDSRGEDSVTIISPQAAYMLGEILTQPVRPDLPRNAESSFRVPKIAWKTGTSYGRRDAWSVGFNRRYTIGIWVGNFTGTGVPELTGADAATPLLFAIFNALEYSGANEWFTPPVGLDFRLVCAETGLPPADFCTNQVIDYYIPGISATRRCEHRRMVFISPDSAISYCGSCLPANGYIKADYPNLPPELIAFYESEHISYPKIPEHNPDCSRIFGEHPPVITSPVNNKTYIIERGEDQKIMLSCTANNDVKTVYWYVNDRFVGSESVGKPVFFAPQPGEMKISCSDDKGRNADIRVRVEER